MTQSSLTSFFSITTRVKDEFHEFIYNPSIGHAYFADIKPEASVIITAVGKIRLWYVIPKPQDEITTFDYNPIEQYDFAINITPLLKSHLQKSIRQMRLSSALRTAYTMCITSPTDLLRRLPVIAIEDVELIHGTSVIVWLMMTISKRKLTIVDVRLILGYVELLIKTKTAFNHDRIIPEDTPQITHKYIVNKTKSLEQSQIMSELLAIYYRTTYGGMIGDVKMMTQALQVYLEGQVSNDLVDTTYLKFPLPNLPRALLENSNSILIPYNSQILPDLLIPSIDDTDFLISSIDFHCYPWMLKKIANKLGFTQSLVKQLNWYCESCVNERKYWTKKRALLNMKSDDWKAIKPQLEGCRRFILNKINNEIYDDDNI